MSRIFAFRQNTGAIVIDKRLIRYGHPGSADILAVLDDRFRDPVSQRSLAGILLAVETKSSRGKQSADQELFERVITSRGAIYVLARSREDLSHALAPLWQP